jgi:hypothetical protein
MQLVIVDRIEGPWAVVVGLGNCPLVLLPAGVQEGSVLHVEHGEGLVVLRLSEASRASAEAAAQALRQELNTVPGGPGEFEL